MVSRRPRMPRVPGAQHAQAEAAGTEKADKPRAATPQGSDAAEAKPTAKDASQQVEKPAATKAAKKTSATGEAKGTATQDGAPEKGDVVELRRAADAADASVTEDSSRIVAERKVDRGPTRTSAAASGSTPAPKASATSARKAAAKPAAKAPVKPASKVSADPAAKPGTKASAKPTPKASPKPASPGRPRADSSAAAPAAQDSTPTSVSASAPASSSTPTSASALIAREPDETVATLHPGARPSSAGSHPAGSRSHAGSRAHGAARAGGTAPPRRFGPGRSIEQAAQDAARRREPAPRPVPARSVTGRSLVVIAVIFIAATLMAPTLRVFLNQSLEIAAAEQDIEDQQRQKAEYEDRIARWEDPDFVRQQARDRLDLVMPGETLYMVTGQDRLQEAPEEPAGAEEEPVNEHLPWAEGLWDSVVRAATEGSATESPAAE